MKFSASKLHIGLSATKWDLALWWDPRKMWPVYECWMANGNPWIQQSWMIGPFYYARRPFAEEC